MMVDFNEPEIGSKFSFNGEWNEVPKAKTAVKNKESCTWNIVKISVPRRGFIGWKG